MLRVSQPPGTKVVVAAAFLLALALAGITLAVPAPARAASPGCDQLNDPGNYAFYSGSFTSGAIYSAGDYLSMTVGEPSELGPTQVELKVDSAIVDTAAYPGTVDYTLLTGGAHAIEWSVNGNATWTVRCVPGQPGVPNCDGQMATIYIDAGGRIVGGPGNGKLYNGKLTGTGRVDVMVGTEARDQIEGRAGSDRICAGGGNDVLDGGAGNDRLTGGTGADRFRGGKGNDTATDFTPAQGDTKASVELFDQPV